MTDDFDDRLTPPERGLSRFTDSERDVMRDRLAVVSEYEEREITAPVDLFERPVRPTESELVRMMRRHPGQLEEFVAKVAARLHERERADSDANRKALADVRALLDRPPDGRLKELWVRVEALEKAAVTSDAGDRMRTFADDVRIKALEGDARFAKRGAQGAIAFVLISALGFLWWFWQRAENAGAERNKLENVIDAVKDLDRKVDRLSRWPQASKDNAP